MKWNKRGSLALSMNAIVVLIMAIAMLGVGLGVIRMVARQAETQIAKLGGEVPEPPVAGPGDRLTFSGVPLAVTAGDSKALKLSFYSTTGFTGQPQLACAQGGDPTTGYQALPKTIPASEAGEYTMVFDIREDAKGTYLCQIVVGDNEDQITKDFQIIVS